MHNTNPRASAFRAYTAGGARATVDKADDKQTMQSMSGNITKGESRKFMEAPQNYGHTSVNAPADKDEKTGKIKDGARFYGTFSQGDRSMGWGIIDDPRHRLHKLDPGDVAQHGLREWGQQMLINKDGIHLTGNEKEKKIRIQLVKNKNDEQDQQSQQQQADSRGGSSGSGAATQKKKQGQESLHKEDSTTFIDMTSGAIVLTRGSCTVKVEGDQVEVYHTSPSDSSMLVTKDHVHIRRKDFRIFVDDEGCWSTVAMAVKKDEHDKS